VIAGHLASDEIGLGVGTAGDDQPTGAVSALIPWKWPPNPPGPNKRISRCADGAGASKKQQGRPSRGGRTAGETVRQGDGGFCRRLLLGVQSVSQRVKGVRTTTSGYSGGTTKTATYRQVITETTGHAESVEVIFDRARITYGRLLRIYTSVAHDPTQLNRHGPDVGTSYRSAIFHTSEDQKRLAQAYIAQLDQAHVFEQRIVTELTPVKAFYWAEDYRQDYAYYNPENPYIQVCDRPKIEALKQHFPDPFVDYKRKK
jgi:peptide-methionine (S)-S-oxide reductase